MKFRIAYYVEKFRLEGSDSQQIEIGGPHNIFVTISRVNEEASVGMPRMRDTGLCIAEGSYTPKATNEKLFTGLANRRIPLSTLSDEARQIPSHFRHIDEFGNIDENYVIPLGYLPRGFQDFYNSVYNELSGAIKKTICLLRWRYNLSGPHNPFAFRGFEWTFDEIDWHPMPHTLRGTVRYTIFPKIDESIKMELSSLNRSGLTEPLAHELLREAKEQQSKNPRSSLVIAIAALETGAKECISKLAPDTGWIWENLQSPPIERVLYEYLPKLTNKPDWLTAFPEILRKTLKKSIHDRNLIVHGHSIRISPEELEKTLVTVQDCLWLFDFINGSTWAINYVTPEVSTTLNIPHE